MKRLFFLTIFIVVILFILISTGNFSRQLDRSCKTDKDCICTCVCGCFNINDKCDTGCNINEHYDLCKGWGPWREYESINCFAGPGKPVCINGTCKAKY